MSGDGSTPEDAACDPPRLTLPDSLRAELAEPLAPPETDAGAVADRAGAPLVAVGDVVTYHLLETGRVPDVAVVDERTKRRAVDDAVAAAVAAEPDRQVVNPPATITADLVAALAAALASDSPTTILVDGEEDLATLPALVLAPDGATVVYGQPDAGMVAVSVTEERRGEIRSLLARFEGDLEAVLQSGR